MMNSLGNKLSTHVMGMKFMRRTKEKVDKDKTEKKFREHYAPAESNKSRQEIKSQILNSSSTSTTTTCIIEQVNSYSQCEGHIFGRQSFGGFNPVLEHNVRKGIWRPFYLDPEIPPDGDEDEDEDVKKETKDEMDVSDEEMAKHYGSLVATLGKRFARKKGQSEPPNKRAKIDPEESPKGHGEKKKGWKGFFRPGKKVHNSGGQQEKSADNNEPQQNEPSTSKSGGGGRGRKRKNNRPNRRGRDKTPQAPKPIKSSPRKFMKPSDDC